jgi:phi13 family phage major tail protein
MKKVGLKYPVYALYSETTGSPVYTGGTVMGKAMSANLSWDKSDVELFADDALDETDQSITGGTETLALNELIHEVQSVLLGHSINANGELIINKNDIAPYVGHGFYGKVKRDGAYKYRAVWLHKMQYGEPSDDNTTKGKDVAFGTPSIEGKIMEDINGDFKSEKLFDTEADAKAYLNEKAGIPVTASTGLTALALTGTGGTLSPAFGAAIRYYTFGGVTGASVTITATAASHTIKLYADGVYVQDLQSGTASAAITMAIGTKKLTITAQQAGKTTQTTEIIVVKTA